jgi:hypothetical protein
VDLVRPSDVYLLEEKAGGASSIKSLSAVPRALVSARLETTLLTILQCRGQSSVQGTIIHNSIICQKFGFWKLVKCQFCALFFGEFEKCVFCLCR